MTDSKFFGKLELQNKEYDIVCDLILVLKHDNG